jgi:hypothetical protein
MQLLRQAPERRHRGGRGATPAGGWEVWSEAHARRFPGVRECSECLDLCHEIMAGRTPRTRRSTRGHLRPTVRVGLGKDRSLVGEQAFVRQRRAPGRLHRSRGRLLPDVPTGDLA